MTVTTIALNAAVAPATAASRGPHAAPAGGRGLPFSTHDLGWLALGALVLLVLVLTLQFVSRRRASSAPAPAAVAPRRADP